MLSPPDAALVASKVCLSQAGLVVESRDSVGSNSHPLRHNLRKLTKNCTLDQTPTEIPTIARPPLRALAVVGGLFRHAPAPAW